MSKRDLTVLTVVVAALLLLLSWQNYTASRSLQEQVAALRSEVGNLRHSISSEISRVTTTVHEMREDARWWSYAGARLEERNLNTAFYRVSWQIKDYQAGSQVVFNYRRRDHNHFTEIPAEEGVNGFFSALVPVEVAGEPKWDFHIHHQTGSRSRPIEEKSEGFYEEVTYQYFFSVVEDSAIRSSDIEHLYVGDLAGGLFTLLHTFVDVREGGEIYVHFEDNPYGDSVNVYYQLQDVTLEVRQGSRFIERHALRGNFKLGAVDATLEPLETGRSLYIVLTYNHGKTIEREIPI